ncbi:hypothetical protein NVP1231O_56 [Vibrio phage 1.231.O._10N.261.49.F8]|nr:hypothetical protein NVP1119O_56 [Vibrio phage 1.119.O._10N.261.51.A9]AUR90428.1 hypothetical protein NVP1143O_56 [Vibrio phage 1.143.O._10N.261.55.C8]AUR96714.1 hypothetical protein NVP1231O_56 [Vibrio phage 1.231.O._10N.261.49.F8]
MSNWRLKKNQSGRLHLISDTGDQICAFWNCKSRNKNARLIKHSPELFELLAEISNEAGYYESQSGMVISWRERADNLLAIISGDDDEL